MRHLSEIRDKNPQKGGFRQMKGEENSCCDFFSEGLCFSFSLNGSRLAVFRSQRCEQAYIRAQAADSQPAGSTKCQPGKSKLTLCFIARSLQTEERRSACYSTHSSPLSVAELASVMRTFTKSPTRCFPRSKTTTRFCSVRPKSCSRERLDTPSTSTS